MTALCVQDGGIAGSAFNLISLVCVGTIAERLWGARRLVLTFFLGGVLSELVALSWQPIGAGNSVANFSLAGSVCLACITQRTTRDADPAAWVAVAGWVVLLCFRDIHGAAALFGTLAGASFLASDRKS